jgi:hypothetical protein
MRLNLDAGPESGGLAMASEEDMFALIVGMVAGMAQFVAEHVFHQSRGFHLDFPVIALMAFPEHGHNREAGLA